MIYRGGNWEAGSKARSERRKPSKDVISGMHRGQITVGGSGASLALSCPFKQRGQSFMSVHQ